MLSVFVWKNFTEEKGKKNCRRKKKIDSRATLMQPEYFRWMKKRKGEGEREKGHREGSRDRSTYLKG